MTVKLVLASALAAIVIGGAGTGVVLVAGPDEIPNNPGGEVVAGLDLPTAPADPEKAAEAEGEPASEEGAERRDAALTFVEAMQSWTACVGEAAPAHDAETGAFDPVAACGEKPENPNAANGEGGEDAGEKGAEGRATGAEKRAAGEATAAEKRAAGEATAAEKRAAGEATAAEKRENAPAAGTEDDEEDEGETSSSGTGGAPGGTPSGRP